MIVEIQDYTVSLFKRYEIAGIECESVLYVRTHNDRQLLIVYCLTENSNDRKDLLWKNGTDGYQGRTYVRNELFRKYLDIVRNEKPVFMGFDDRPNLSDKFPRCSIHTNREPVGEGEAPFEITLDEPIEVKNT